MGGVSDNRRLVLWAVAVLRLVADRVEAAYAAPTAPIANDNEDLAAWYQRYLADEIAAGRQPSREEDYRAALLAGIPVTHSKIRQLRGKYIPPEWSRKGRPRLEESRSSDLSDFDLRISGRSTPSRHEGADRGRTTR